MQTTCALPFGFSFLDFPEGRAFVNGQMITLNALDDELGRLFGSVAFYPLKTICEVTFF
jgi:hypothetical protein